MRYRQLIAASKTHLAGRVTHVEGPRVFSLGARWMYDRMRELDDIGPFDPTVRYTGYGLLKYGVCLTASSVLLLLFGPLAIPLSIVIFYLFEVHFLFLFPLLIDQTPHPILASVRATYKIGLAQCFFTVIPIAVYMMAGLFRKTNRLDNWYVGCLAIVIWYNHEIRNRN
ncbi:MAG: hypothetical protein JST68_22095 [Bacteroidetes bacterium]|nr:hypothetical protein [Bacteroidota bacterium]